MYKFYLGTHNNIGRKKEGEPFVIETEPSAMHEIEMWLDKFTIDLDTLIETVISVTSHNIGKITLDDTHIFKMQMDDDSEAFVEILDNDKPKCRIKFNEDEYLFSLYDGTNMETVLQVRDGIRMGVNKTDKNILLGKEEVLIAIELEEYEDWFFDAIKEHINQLSMWDNIASVMCWIRDLNLGISSYDLSIVSNEKTYFGANKVYTIHDRIFKYVHMNSHGEYQVDYDGTWEARHMGYLFQYTVHDKRLFIGIPEKSRVHVLLAQKYFDQVKELVETMSGTLKIINNSFDEIENRCII